MRGLFESREREDQLAVALRQAKTITSGIKYDDTVNGIISEIQTLANQLKIDPRSVKYAINDVLEAKNNLESAVYGLDELFKDAWQEEKWKNDDEEEGISEEENKPKSAKALIYQTEMYGAKGYYGQCKEPGCDHKTRTYDRIQQAQNAIKKHHQEHFKVTETHSTGTTIGSAGVGGGAGLGIEKSPIEKILEKPFGIDEHINSPGGMGQSYRKFTPKTKEPSEVEENLLNTYGDMFGFPKESSIMKGLQNEREIKEYDVDSSRRIEFSKDNPPDLSYLYHQFIHKMLSSTNTIKPNDWIKKVNDTYGLNYTYKDYQNWAHRHDHTGGWDNFVKKHVLGK